MIKTNFDYSLINNWIHKNPLTDYERRVLSGKFIWPFARAIRYNDKYKELEKEYFNLLVNYKINESRYNITFGDCATELIDKLFKTYVDEDTLVISTTGEHPSVNKNLDRCKNKLLINNIVNQENYNNILCDIEGKVKDYKKVFIYIIGTVVLSQETVSDEFFISLKELLIDLNKEHKIVLDDVQGMFLTERNYNLFDYIIGTAHALTMNYNMGIIIGKNNLPIIGYYYYGLAKKWLKMIKILLKCKNVLNKFNFIMTEFYRSYIESNKQLYYNKNSDINYIFHINTYYTFTQKQRNYLHNKYKIEIESLKSFRFRATNFIIKPNYLISSIKEVNKLINNKK